MNEVSAARAVSEQLSIPNNDRSPMANYDRRTSQGFLTLHFKESNLEQEFLYEVSVGRFPILMAIAVFDVFMNTLRVSSSLFTHEMSISVALHKLVTHFCALALFYGTLSLLNFWSRRHKRGSQEEIILSSILAVVISALICSPFGAADDWVYAAYFLICTTAILKFRWFIGATALTLPLVTAAARQLNIGPFSSSSLSPLPDYAPFQMAVAWMVGCLMGFLSDSNRRQAFISQRTARYAAAKELEEVNARLNAERELAAAQTQTEARALIQEQERASLEAKHSFVSMLCHEVRTPLSGCLASAELLLETPLNDDQLELARTVRVSGAILMSTVSSFLDFFKLEAGKQLDVVKMPVSLASLIADTYRVVEALIDDDSQVRLLDPDVSKAPPAILADSGRLCGVLLNLCTNAVKFTRNGHIQLRVRAVPAGQRPSAADAQQFCMAEQPSVSSGLGTMMERSTSNSDPYPDSSSTASLPDAALFSGSEHDSVMSMRYNNNGMARPSSRRSTTTSRNNNSGNSPMHMTLVDEGSGWLSTCSRPPRRRSNSGGSLTASTTSDEEQPTPSTSPPSDTTSLPSPQNQDQWLLFEVMDTGAGVPPKSLAALFKDFSQGDASDMKNPRSIGGTGLGLAICSKQIAVMGGHIGAISKPDTGSIFWFAIPSSTPSPTELASLPLTAAEAVAKKKQNLMLRVRSADKLQSVGAIVDNNETNLVERWRADAHFDDEDPGYIEEENNSVEAASLANVDTNAATDGFKSGSLGIRNGLKVLLAEDNLINLRVAERVLKSLGAVVTVAHDGRQAVEAVQKIAEAGDMFDVIVMDMIMPVMSGLEATQEVRRQGFTLPIIALTANTMEEQECFNAGMNAYLTKPVFRERLAECLRDCCPAAVEQQEINTN